MGCDIHVVLERCLRKPDAATQRTRVLCILLAKRAASEPLQDAAQEPPQDVAQKDKSPFELPSELWLRIAQECPVTFGEVDKWVRCRYAEWVVADAPLWSRLHAEFKAKYMAAAALAREEVSQSRSEQPDEDEGELDEDEDAGDKVECEVHQQALHAAGVSRGCRGSRGPSPSSAPALTTASASSTRRCAAPACRVSSSSAVCASVGQRTSTSRALALEPVVGLASTTFIRTILTCTRTATARWRGCSLWIGMLRATLRFVEDRHSARATGGWICHSCLSDAWSSCGAPTGGIICSNSPALRP